MDHMHDRKTREKIVFGGRGRLPQSIVDRKRSEMTVKFFQTFI